MQDQLFLRDESYYQRNINPLREYVLQAGYYLSKVKGIPYKEACQGVQEAIKAKFFPKMKNPVVEFFHRPAGEDKFVEQMPLTEYLSTISSENLTLAPTMTCYVHGSEKPSILSEFTDTNTAIRSKAKKKAAVYKAEGNIVQFNIFNGEQENRKIYNNAASGAFEAGGSVIRNPTSHSSLTSTTRTMTSIGNAGNERMISGNRHYRTPEITLNNLVSILTNSDFDEIHKAITDYGLVYPDVQQTMDCLYRSTSPYWSDIQKLGKIRSFVEKLEPVERAAIVYTGDLYHIRVCNPLAIRTFLSRLSQKVTGVHMDDPVKSIRSTDELIVNYVHQVCITEVRGIGKDYSKISHDAACTVAATCANVVSILEEYQGFIRAFFLSKNLPCSVAYIRDIVRRTVVLSDTDSTMFSCDEWALWYFNDLKFDDEAFAVSGSVMFMATQCISHNLAIYSANINVERSKLHKAAMKPEFVFPVFSLTSVAKHYYTYVFIKEGSVYKEYEKEVKGVHLKNSASPKVVIEDAQNQMEAIMQTVLDGKKISLTEQIIHVLDLEKTILEDIRTGGTTYLGRLTIKDAGSYKGTPESSNYRYHLVWEELFVPKYGFQAVTPYKAVKIPTLLDTKARLLAWAQRLEDKSFGERVINWMTRTGRKDLNTIYLPLDFVSSHGLPIELMSAIDADSLLLAHTKSHRMVLESLGYFPKRDLPLIRMAQ